MGSRAHDALLAKQIKLERKLAIDGARKGLLNFIRWVRPDYEINWHHRLLCRVLNKVERGEITRLIICTPPQHGKSEIVSRMFPAYLLGRNPDRKYIGASYAASLAHKNARDVQRIMSTNAYGELFPGTQLKGFASSWTQMERKQYEKEFPWLNVRTSKSYIRTSSLFECVGRRGYCLSAGVGGGMTGHGGDVACVDDPVASWEQAISKAYRERSWDWFTSVLTTRLSKSAVVIITLTRWNIDDLAGRVIKLMKADPNADQYTVLNLPGIKKGPPTDLDPRQDGEALWADRYPLETLLARKATLGPRKWAALFDGDPAPDGGGIVERSWWKFCRQAELPDRFDRTILSADLAFKGKKKNDFSVFQLWGVLGAKRYLLKQWRAQMGWVRQKRRFKAICLRHKGIHGKWIEDAANGAALVDEMKGVVPGVRAIPLDGTSKIARAEAVAEYIHAGDVYLPHPDDEPWVNDYIEEWAAFPEGEYDDQVDATSQFLLEVGSAPDHSKVVIPGDSKTSAWAGSGLQRHYGGLGAPVGSIR